MNLKNQVLLSSRPKGAVRAVSSYLLEEIVDGSDTQGLKVSTKEVCHLSDMPD